MLSGSIGNFYMVIDLGTEVLSKMLLVVIEPVHVGYVTWYSFDFRTV